MKTICILNLKGGCAKTTTAVSMAELLATGFERDGIKVLQSRVLLFDNDKQGNASRLFDVYQNEKESPAAAVLKTGRMSGNIRRTRVRGLDIVSCNYFMEYAELAVKADAENAQHLRFKQALEGVKEKYNYCIIDNAPDLGMNVINALVAADEIIIPVNLDSYALDGLEELVAQVDYIRQLNRKTRLSGVLITDYEKSSTSEAAESWLRARSGLPIFDTVIRHSAKVSESTFYKRTPISYSVRSGAAQGYKSFVKEYLLKLSESEVS